MNAESPPGSNGPSAERDITELKQARMALRERIKELRCLYRVLELTIDDARKETGKGTGLGLSMVYGFVKQSQGHVKVYSEPGQGTTVKLYLPRATESAAITAEPVGPAGAIVGGDETVLLVEDNDLVRTYAEGQLARLGYRVLSATNGPEALALIREHADIDLLFTDIVMPGGMSGRDLAEAAQPLRPDLKVLYTSGYTESAIVHQGRLDPGVQLLGKPYRRSELARRIREVLDGA